VLAAIRISDERNQDLLKARKRLDDEADLDLGRHGLLLVLEAVARADVDDLDFGGEVHGALVVG